MGAGTVYADSTISGTATNAQNAFGASDGVFTGDTGNTSWTQRWGMGNPTGGALSGTQTVTFIVRKQSGTNNPTMTASLYQNGSLIQQILASTNVTSLTSQTVTATFTGSLITDPTNIEIEIATTAAGGSGAARAAVQVDSIALAYVTDSAGNVAAVTATASASAPVPTVSGGSAGGGGGGTVALAGTPSVYESASGTSVIIPYPAGVAAGELLLACVTDSASTATNSPPSGWTTALAQNGPTTAPSTVVYYRVADGTETGSATFPTSGTAGRITGTMQRWSGVDTTTPLDATPVGNNSAIATTFTMPSITTVTDNALLVHTISLNASSSSDIVTLSGTTKVTGSTGTGRRQGVFSEPTTTAGATGTKTWAETSTTALQWSGITVALRPGAALPASGDVAAPVATATMSATAPAVNAGGTVTVAATLSTASAAAPAPVVSGGGGSATIAMQGTGTIYESASSASIVIPYPSGIVAGELLLAQGIFAGGVVPDAPPTGWTLAADADPGANISGAVWYRVADGTETGSVTFTSPNTANRATGHMQRWSGVDTTTPLDVAGVVGTATGTSVTAPSMTTVNDGAMLIYSVGVHASTSADITTPAGYTQVANSTGTGRRLVVFDKSQTTAGATGTQAFDQTSAVALEMFAIGIALRPGAGGGGGGTSPTLVSRIVGIPTSPSTSAVVQIKMSGGTSARLMCATDSTMTSGVVYGSSASPDANGNVRLTATGLTPNTRYYYRVAMTNSSGTEYLDTATVQGRLRTAPSGAASFAFDFASCCNATDSASMAAIAARDDELFFHLGDLFYADATGTSLANFRTQFGNKITVANHAAVFQKINMTYTPSDHDGMNNNTNAGSDPTAWANWNTVAGEMMPMPSTYYTFTWGRVRFIQIDRRSFATAPSATDNSSKTCLGATQKQWLKDTITNATEPVICIINADPWIGSATAGDDGWFGYTTERTELANFFSASGKNINMIGGDMHAVAADSGVNAPGGIAVFQGSPLNQNASQKGGPYSAGVYPASGTTVVQQYARVAVTDTGGSTITFDYTGYSSDNTARITMQKVYTVPSSAGATAVPATATTQALAPSVGVSPTVVAVTATATTLSPVPVVSGSAGISAAPATATAQSPAPAVAGSAAVLAVAATTTANSPVPTVDGQIVGSVLSVAATGSTAALAPSVNAAAAGSVTVVRAQASATALAPVVAGLVVGSVTAVPATASASALVPLVGAGAIGSVSAVAATASSAAPAPAVAGLFQGNVSAVAAVVTTQAVGPVITGLYQGNVSAVAAIVSLSAPNPVIGSGAGASVPAASVSASALVPNVSGSATVVAATATVTASAHPGIATTGSGVVAVKATATATALPPVVAGGYTVTTTAATATTAARIPTVSVVADVVAVCAQITAGASAPTLQYGRTIVSVVASSTATAIAPFVQGTGAANISAVVATASATAQAPGLRANLPVVGVTADIQVTPGIPVVSASSVIQGKKASATTQAFAPEVGGLAGVVAVVAAASTAANAPTLTAAANMVVVAAIISVRAPDPFIPAQGRIMRLKDGTQVLAYRLVGGILVQVVPQVES